ncbi:VOC family protein [Amycolatopsis nigrescens]|uniref:VOC family protein n=1 Tax=Amycolatopsis nigrescens TaxID=381445 RepID=UPI0003631034|nr:VOC family protein [Amycolatopsis nigrescens]
MSVQLNHTIVPATDKHASAEFLAGILGLEVGAHDFFVPIELDHGVLLDFMDAENFGWQHYAFLVSEAEFDAAFARITAAGARYYGTPDKAAMGEIYFHNGGRGVYFEDPDGHAMELLTVPNAPGEEWVTGPYGPNPALAK